MSVWESNPEFSLLSLSVIKFYQFYQFGFRVRGHTVETDSLCSQVAIGATGLRVSVTNREHNASVEENVCKFWETVFSEAFCGFLS